MKNNKWQRMTFDIKLSMFKPTKTILILFSAMIAMVGLVVVAQSSTITQQINYQGKLTDSSNIAVSDGGHEITFRIYASSTDSVTCVWAMDGSCASPNPVSATTTSGLFSMMLGNTDSGHNALDLDFATTTAEYVLGVKIGSDSEMTPRKVIGAAAMAFNADRLDGKSEEEFATLSEDETITGDWSFEGVINATTTQTDWLTVNNDLTVSGSATTTGSMNIDGDLTVDGLGSFASAALTIDSSGNLITTGYASTTAGLFTQGSGHFGQNLTIDGSATTTGSFYVGTNNFVVTENGNVGIGSIAPSEKLVLQGGNFLQSATDFTPSETGSLNLPDHAYSLYVSGKYAYVGTHSSGDDFHIIDISDPTSPSETGSLDLPSYALSLYVSGKYAYVGTAFTGDDFHIIDISDPTSPSETGSLDLASNANSLYVSGKYAYVGTHSSGDDFHVIDISDPTSPSETGSLDLADSALSLYVSGKYAYVGTASTGDDFHIIDISDPTSPSEIGSLDLPSYAYSLYVSGKYAYVGTHSSGDDFHVIDISDPTSPSETGSLDLADTARSLYVSGKYAYVGTHSSGDDFHVIDISDPTSPSETGSLNLSDSALSLYVSGKYAYVGTASGGDDFHIIDIAGIDAPSAQIGDIAAGTIDVWENLNVGNDLLVRSGLSVGPQGIMTDGALSVNATNTDSFFGGNVGIGTSSPSAFLDIGKTSGSEDNLFAISSTTNGDLLTIDASGNFGISTSTPGTWHGETLAVSGNTHLYGSATTTGSFYVGTNNFVVTENGNVGIGSITPSEKLVLQGGNFLQSATDFTPSETGSLDLPDTALSVYVSGKYAYVGTFSTGDDFHIIDISDPTSLSETGSLDLADSARSVYVSGKYAYVGTYSDGDDFHVIDISDPTSPSETGSLNLPSHAYSVYVSGKYAYVGTLSGGDDFHVIDISDPTSPSETGSLDLPDHALSVYVSGKYAYVGTFSTGDDFHVIDISDPTSPSETGSLNLSDSAYSVYVSGKYAYVTTDSTGDDFHVIDISDPTSPSETGSLNLSDSAFSLYVSGKYAYVGTASGGDDFHIIDIAGIDAPSAQIGDIAAGTIDVWENLNVGNDLLVRSGLSVGPQGIMTDGALSVNATNTDSFFGGNVGIGTTGPTGMLQVERQSGGIETLFQVGTSTDSDIFTVKSDGNVGIGTTSPDHLLHLSGGGLCIDNAAGDCGSMNESTGSATTTGSLWVAGDARVVGTLDSSDIQFHNLQNEPIWTITEGDRVGETSTDLVLVNQDKENSFIFSQDGFEARSSSNTPMFVLTKDMMGYYGARVAIATTTPTNVLTVGQGMGSAIADGWDVYSSRQYKTGITYLEEQDYDDILDEIENIKVAQYNWKDSDDKMQTVNQSQNIDSEQASSSDKMLGLIAEEAPSQILGQDGKSVSLYDFASYNLAGIKALNSKFEKMSRVLDIEEDEDGNLFIAQATSSVLTLEQDGEKVRLSLNEDGFVEIDKLKVKELEIAQDGQMTMPEGPNEIIGRGMIMAYSTSTEIKNSKIATSSKIFATFTSNLAGASWWICDKVPGEMFRICLSEETEEDLEFDYWIVQTRQFANASSTNVILNDEDCENDRHYIDSDGDGYGYMANYVVGCNPPEGYVDNKDDCDDNNKEVYPGAEEVCGDGIDNNCDGLVDDCEAEEIEETGGAEETEDDNGTEESGGDEENGVVEGAEENSGDEENGEIEEPAEAEGSSATEEPDNTEDSGAIDENE